MIDMNQEVHETERGFILPTSLVMLVLLTMLSIATYYGTIISQQTSATAQDSTQAFYYAETGLSYVAWAMKNDAELDGYDPVVLGDPYGRRIDYAGNLMNPYASGDRREWAANRGNPSNLQSIQAVFSGYSAPFTDVYGQLGYFDNRDIYSRPVALLQNATGVSDIYTLGEKGDPSFRDLYTQLGGYIRLDIDTYGQITSSFSPYVQSATVQHAAAAHICKGSKNDKNPTIDGFPTIIGDVPCNGAIVWLTAGDPYTDKVLYPIDPYVAAPLFDAYGNHPLVSNSTSIVTQACVDQMLNCNSKQPFPMLESCSATSCSTLASSASSGITGTWWGTGNSIDVYSNGVNKTLGGSADPTVFPAYYQALPCDLSTYFPASGTNLACEQPVDLKGIKINGKTFLGKLKGGVRGKWLNNKDTDSTNNYNLVIYAIGYSGGKARKMIRMMIQL